MLVPTQSQNAHIVNVSHCLELYLLSEVRAGNSITSMIVQYIPGSRYPEHC